MPRLFGLEESRAYLLLGVLGVALAAWVVLLATAEYFGWRIFRGPCKPLQVELCQRDAEALLDVGKTHKALLEERRTRRKPRKYQLPSSKPVARRRGNILKL